MHSKLRRWCQNEIGLEPADLSGPRRLQANRNWIQRQMDKLIIVYLGC